MSTPNGNFKITLNGKPTTIGRLAEKGFVDVIVEGCDNERPKEEYDQYEKTDSKKNSN